MDESIDLRKNTYHSFNYLKFVYLCVRMWISEFYNDTFMNHAQ